LATHRTLRYEHEYEDGVASLLRNDDRYQEIIEGIEWGIATRAEEYPLALEEETGIADMRVAPGDPVGGGLVPIHVIFTIDGEDHCTLWWAGEVDLSEFLATLF
jgi:hypothetical protein